MDALYRPAGAVQLRNAITEHFGIALPPTATLDYPTVAALARFVVQSRASVGSAPTVAVVPASTDDARIGESFAAW